MMIQVHARPRYTVNAPFRYASRNNFSFSLPSSVAVVALFKHTHTHTHCHAHALASFFFPAKCQIPTRQKKLQSSPKSRSNVCMCCLRNDVNPPLFLLLFLVRKKVGGQVDSLIFRLLAKPQARKFSFPDFVNPEQPWYSHFCLPAYRNIKIKTQILNHIPPEIVSDTPSETLPKIKREK